MYICQRSKQTSLPLIHLKLNVMIFSVMFPPQSTTLSKLLEHDLKKVHKQQKQIKGKYN